MIFFQQLLLFISLIFVGHISGDSLELDAAGEGIRALDFRLLLSSKFF